MEASNHNTWVNVLSHCPKSFLCWTLGVYLLEHVLSFMTNANQFTLIDLFDVIWAQVEWQVFLSAIGDVTYSDLVFILTENSF